ncbi:CASP-like protein 1B1 [Phragmites australis]|uniref:CASP-like protein 1B1 n=1 Tax=Phragmites australis TaxID=29695 RepID=UPI002D7808EC|nr:CASP-like protein 1B1 [Phragmites australis]
MDLEHGNKKPSAPAATSACTLLQLRDRLITLQPIVLRAAAALTTAVAAAVMALNTQSYTAVVAIVGTRPLTQTFTAKFRDTPAFVYFVIANAIAGVYNMVVLVMRRLLRRRTASLVVHMLDMVIMALLATGAATAASMAELGKNGNLHARWNPICDRFGSFCNRGGIALVSSFIGVALMLALNLLSAAANAPQPNMAGQ